MTLRGPLRARSHRTLELDLTRDSRDSSRVGVRRRDLRTYFMYNPRDKQFKVTSMISAGAFVLAFTSSLSFHARVQRDIVISVNAIIPLSLTAFQAPTAYREPGSGLQVQLPPAWHTVQSAARTAVARACRALVNLQFDWRPRPTASRKPNRTIVDSHFIYISFLNSKFLIP